MDYMDRNHSSINKQQHQHQQQQEASSQHHNHRNYNGNSIPPSMERQQVRRSNNASLSSQGNGNWNNISSRPSYAEAIINYETGEWKPELEALYGDGPNDHNDLLWTEINKLL